MEAFKLLLPLLLLISADWLSASSASTSALSDAGSSPAQDSAATTLGNLYRKTRQSRCVHCYDDRYPDDYDRGRNRGSSYYSGSRANDDRPSNWYYPNERYYRYDNRVKYGGDRDNDRYYYSSYYRDRNDDRYSTRTYDRYDRDRYDSRYSYDRSPSENRGYGYDNRDRYYPNDYYRGGDRYAERNRGSASTYDRYAPDDRYYSRYDYRNYRPWDETYRGQSGFDNSGRGYYFANDRPNDYYDDPPYRPQSRPSGPSTPGPAYLPKDPYYERPSRPSNSNRYPDSRPGSSTSSPSSPSSSSSSSPSSSDYGNRPRDDGRGGGGTAGAAGSGSDNKSGYMGGSWSYVNDREKDASYKGGIRDKDNQSSSYGSGSRGRPLGGSYLLDRDTNVPDGPMMNNNPDKMGDNQNQDSPTASKLSSPSSSSTDEKPAATEAKDSN